jgi:heme oxygenase (biliverdin-IX-beta and delta-forming)
MHPAEDFDPARAAKRLLREATKGSLATLAPGGAPYASLVTVASAMDGAPILLLSQLARHTANIVGDARASLLLEAANARDPLAEARVSLAGTLSRTETPAARRRFLLRHPAAAAYADFADFGFWQMQVADAHLVAGFGRIVDLTRDDLLTAIGDAAPLAAAEADALAHMNADHQDAIALYATRLLGEAPGAWRIVAIDPEGCDLMCEGRARRLEFPERVADANALRRIFVKLTEAARARR